ncbi:MAG: anti-sigma F factor [Firmicutes bacterium]|jgi:stage II sporulation protein AB (anti-sigma F factor)|nr:anti-sigma F factor [Bacillota bacterium]
MASEADVRNRVHIEVDSVPENIGLVRLAVAGMAAHARFTLAEVEEIKVAVSEAVSNSVIHGYRDGRGVIKVTAVLEPGGMRVTVRDEGSGMADVEECRRARGGGDPERMGLGFMFMESLMDSLEVESSPGRGTTVRMFKAFTREAGPGG